MSRPSDAVPQAAIYGCAGLELTDDEVLFFGDCNPLGLILFARNIESPVQVTSLVEQFRKVSAQKEPLILIDQEGGRVARLGPPHWPATPPAREFGVMYERDPDAAIEAARQQAAEQAAELKALGINVNCTPVLDLSRPETHSIIGDRAFSGDVEVVAALGRAVCEGHLSQSVAPVIKHVPGHGRATADSHLELPEVSASEIDLEGADFAPFKSLSDMPVAMTAHIVFSDLDAARPATLSKKVIERIIRGKIGFSGLLLSDDIGMKALQGTFADRAREVLDAGCDAVLHCSGDFDEMRDVSSAVSPMGDAALTRYEAVCGAVGNTPEGVRQARA